MRPGIVIVAVFGLATFACGSGGSNGGSGVPTGGSGPGGGGTPGGGGAPGGGGSSGGGSSGGGASSGGASACGGEPTHAGEATYYDFADGSGNCSFDPTPNDLMVGAMNHADYADSAACGACAHVVGPKGEVTIRVVDRCPECPQGDIDLSPEAFAKIADLPQGRVDISWQYVPCSVNGPIRYRFKEGSNQWWTALQLRNHRHAVAKLEYRASDGLYRNVARESYNYFVEPNGMGPGPYEFRVTDVYGHVLEDQGIAHLEAGEVPGAQQFPDCATP